MAAVRQPFTEDQMPAATKLQADRWRQTSSERKKMQRQSEKNKKFVKVPVEITSQPEKRRDRYVGRVTFVWKSGPKRDEKCPVTITLGGPARLTIRGKDLVINPRDGDQYIWGAEKEETDGMGKDASPHEPKNAAGKKREKRFRDQLQEKYDELIEARGPNDAGRSMARGFVIAYNKIKGKVAKRALAKIYGVVLETNKAGHKSFSRAVKRSDSMTKRVPVKSTMNHDDRIEIAASLIEAVESLDPVKAGWVEADATVMAMNDLPEDNEFASLDHTSKVKQKLYAARSSAGKKVGVRLDIPSVKRGLPVVSIHATASGGKVIGYDHSATTKNARFIVQASGQRDIGAMGANKRPMAYIGGTLSDEPAKVKGTPIYFDPRKVHLFVDATNMRPVKGARTVYSVGKKVFAVGIEYYGPGEAPRPLAKEYKKAIPLFYTGLKDKNGKEIYEGDIVTFLLVDYDTGKERKMMWEIKWVDDEALFGMKVKSGDELLMDVNLGHLEIIGNIYENPELLGG